MNNESVPWLRLLPFCLNHFRDFLVCSIVSISLSLFRVHSDYNHEINHPQAKSGSCHPHAPNSMVALEGSQLMFMSLICHSLSALLWGSEGCLLPPLISDFSAGLTIGRHWQATGGWQQKEMRCPGIYSSPFSSCSSLIWAVTKPIRLPKP